jgi:hypothetical protein
MSRADRMISSFAIRRPIRLAVKGFIKVMFLKKEMKFLVLFFMGERIAQM